MTDLRTSSTVRLRLPATGTGRRPGRRAPAAAAGLLVAVVLGGSALLLPGGSADAADELTTSAEVQPTFAHPVRPEVPAPTAVPPVPAPALQLRDPFRPLVSDSGKSTPDTPVAPPPSGTPPVVEPALVQVPPAPEVPVRPEGSTGVPTGTPTTGGPSSAGRRLSLTRVEAVGDGFEAVLALDTTSMRAAVGASFGPGGELLLLSLQQGPADGQWTAVVQRGLGEPFDVVTGTPARLP